MIITCYSLLRSLTLIAPCAAQSFILPPTALSCCSLLTSSWSLFSPSPYCASSSLSMRTHRQPSTACSSLRPPCAHVLHRCPAHHYVLVEVVGRTATTSGAAGDGTASGRTSTGEYEDLRCRAVSALRCHHAHIGRSACSQGLTKTLHTEADTCSTDLQYGMLVDA